MKKTTTYLFCFLLTTFSIFSQNPRDAAVKKITAIPGNKVTIDSRTGAVSFIMFSSQGSQTFVQQTGTPAEKALQFVNDNSALLSIDKVNEGYSVQKTRKDNYGLDHVTLQQNYKGVPVFDGVLKFHFRADGSMSSLNGNKIVIAKAVPTNPALSASQAEALAIKKVGSTLTGINKPVLNSEKTSLQIFQKGLIQGYNGPKHLVYEVIVTDKRNTRELMYVDAHTGEFVEQFTGIHPIDRELYETSYTAPNLKWKENDAFPGTLDQWQQSEVETSSHIYNMMKNAFGHTSYNNLDAKMITVNNDPGISCPNANWNGTTANYCTGVATDDVVAHEWGHAYTEYTNNLIYGYQSGALNESYSDIWGETVDQLNSYFDSGETGELRTGCVECSRWKMGEKSTSFGGAIRDMWNPNTYSDPGKVSDLQYICTSADAGGVHTNSGIQNHAYALLVDGGTYNGQTITGLGITKAAHIFWLAQLDYVTRSTGFASQADNLTAALNDLIGINLKTISTGEADLGLSGQIITLADAAELAKVLLAVEMRNAPTQCNFTALLAPVPAICGGGTNANALYLEDFEDGLTGWTLTNTDGVDWAPITNPGNGRTGTVAFGLNSELCVPGANGSMSLASPAITIPASAAGPFYLAFDHNMATEFRWDGGNLKYKIGAGAFALVPASAFINNPYNSTLYTVAQGNDNPLAGQAAFTGADGGMVTGSWGQSRIDLTALGLDAGETIELRWDIGQDYCGGWIGWYIDDVRVYSCTTPSVQFELAGSTVPEADGITANASPQCLPYVEKTVTVKINKAPSTAATVTFGVPTGTAKMGSTADFTFSPSSVILDADHLTQDVIVRIYNDGNLEGNETAILNYTLDANGGDAILEAINQTHTLTIVDSDREPGLVTNILLDNNFEAVDPLLNWSFYLGDGITPDPTGGTFPASWFVNEEAGYLDPTGSHYLMANSDATGPSYPWDKIIETPAFNTSGMSTIKLQFLDLFVIYDDGSDFDETATVEVLDGDGNWHNVLTHTEAGGDVGTSAAPVSQSITIPIAYSSPAMKVRFRYTANWDYYWVLDNVKVIGETPILVQTAVNTANSTQEYLGPEETAVFYDPTTGNIMAKIKNLSTHDYGCTTVEVDRAGNGSTNWVQGYQISKKTYKVTPTTNNPTGQYEITLYYSYDDLNGYLPSIQSMGKSSGSITAGTTGLFAEVEVGDAYFSDYSFKATFGSGFSGFGLSTAPPIGALSVKLLSFKGKPTPEGNELNWVTSSETNNSHFLVERSTDGKVFSEIGMVTGHGSTLEQKNYSFLDKSPIEQVNYYRLKDVDLNGKMGMSQTIAIKSLELNGMTFWPNPAKNSLNFNMADGSQNVDFKVFNSSGIQVISKKEFTNDGNFKIDIMSLPTGIYEAMIQGKKGIRKVKFMKD